MMKPHFRVYTCSQLRADLENAETSYRIGRETVDFTLNELKAKLSKQTVDYLAEQGINLKEIIQYEVTEIIVTDENI